METWVLNIVSLSIMGNYYVKDGDYFTVLSQRLLFSKRPNHCRRTINIEEIIFL